MSDRILVVSAHPDDETYGAGGTIARHAAMGDEVVVLFMTDGVGSRHGVAEPQKEAGRSACAALGVKDVVFADLPDQQLDVTPLTAVIDPIYKLVKELRPRVVYTHHKGDANQDHRRVFEATLVAVRPFGDNPVEEVMSFEVASSTEWGPSGSADWAFLPDVFVDITPYTDAKLQAIEAYRHTFESEVRPYPHPRSPEAMTVYNTARGVAVGMETAEAFVSIRRLLR